MAERKKRGKGKGRSRLYWRGQGGSRRAYGDFRDYSAYGGGREALVPPGEKLATTDPDLAATLLARRLSDLERLRRGRVIVGLRGDGSFSHLINRHLEKKAASGKITEKWLGDATRHLETAREYFERATPGDPASEYVKRDIGTITVDDVRGYVAYLRTLPSRRKSDGEPSTLADGTVRHYLVSLSNAFRRAIEEGIVPSGYNPAHDLMEKPQQRSEEARWLEVHDAALLLESARLHKATRSEGISCMHQLLATMLLTGGRKSEVLGLAVDDISFDRRTVTFRPHPHRRLKTKSSHRVVPLWPQLEAILRPYVDDLARPAGTLLLPSALAGRLLFPSALRPDAMINDLRKSLDLIAGRVGWKDGEMRTKMLRHTYCSARLQTLDGGAPVSPFTVARELGHGGDALVKKVYGHLGTVRHRSEAVEYNVNEHRDRIKDQLQQLYANHR